MNKPNYYAILTADVRYDKSLSSLTKLIYAEVTALSNAYGYADPSDEFLAAVFEKDVRTIQRSIQQLKNNNHIKIVHIRGISKGTTRRIYPNKMWVKNPKKSHDKNVVSTHDKNVVDHMTKMSSHKDFNITRKNNTRDSAHTHVEESDLTLEIIKHEIQRLKLNESSQRIYHVLKQNNFKNKSGTLIDSKNIESYIIGWSEMSKRFGAVVIKHETEASKWAKEILDAIDE